MKIEHRVEPFGAGWTAKAWQQRLDELAAEGFRFVQSIDRVDGFWIILVKVTQPPSSGGHRPTSAGPGGPGEPPNQGGGGQRA